MRMLTMLSFFCPAHKEPVTAQPEDVNAPSKIDDFIKEYVESLEVPSKYDLWCQAARKSRLLHEGMDPE